MKIVINVCYGGFGLSKEAYKFLGLKWDNYGYKYQNDRANPKLIKCVETLGSKKSSGGCSRLKVVEIPDNIKWSLKVYDGNEHIAEDHRTWG